MTEQRKAYIQAIKDYCENNYRACFREPNDILKHPFIVPGSAYAYELWDWDSWLTDLALGAIAKEDISAYEKGCILNFLEHMDKDGRMPINIVAGTPGYNGIFLLKEGVENNIHKPCLAQHALFVCEKLGDASWLADHFDGIVKFLTWYENNQKHAETGLFFWINDFAIGVDNDPCTFYRPDKSTASIYLNCLMYKEYEAAAALARMLGREADGVRFETAAAELAAAIRRECWDERNGFYYSADINLKPVDPNEWLHSGSPRHWRSLPMRIDVWTGFLPMWCGFATAEEVHRMVEENLKNERTFAAPYGVRSVSRLERMYTVKVSGNPSCWLGPIWGNANYMVFEGLLRYGYETEAREMAEKTVDMFGRDILACGEMHEYYDPDTGLGVHNQGFQSWNLLCYRMAQWLEEHDA
ncbi:MAG: glycoside hydrolase family 37 [Clostridia bacterium]|nr:glycoside hydrolase family 37 [Clostridia bacterium]